MSESGKTPGQAAYEAAEAHSPYGAPPWDANSDKLRAAWEAAATAAIDWWHAERDLEPPRTITGVAPELDAARAVVDAQRTELAGLRAGLQTAEAEREGLRELLTAARERLENLAAGMEMSAATSRPSKKSEIEQGCANAVRGIAERMGASGITTAGTEHL